MSTNAVTLLDELLRKELRVSNPRDPKEMARALRDRYQRDALRMDAENLGLPSTAPQVLAAPVATSQAASRELDRAQANLQADLDTLVNAARNRDRRAELEGWRSKLVAELDSAAADADLAQDPGRAEQVWLTVRTLVDHARVARIVSLSAGDLKDTWRRLARTLDDGAWALRVRMGEVLAEAGVGVGGVMIQVPESELRARRDAVLEALGWLTGERTVPSDDWGDTAASLMRLRKTLAESGNRDLRGLLRENSMRTLLDGVLHAMGRNAGAPNPAALRGLAATLPSSVNRLRQLERAARAAVQAASGRDAGAALQAFADRLALLVDAFSDTRGDRRLVDLAVPFALIRRDQDDDATNRDRIRDLISLRAKVQAHADCLCSCDDLDDQAVHDLQAHGLTDAIDRLIRASESDQEYTAKLVGWWTLVGWRTLGGGTLADHWRPLWEGAAKNDAWPKTVGWTAGTETVTVTVAGTDPVTWTWTWAVGGSSVKVEAVDAPALLAAVVAAKDEHATTLDAWFTHFSEADNERFASLWQWACELEHSERTYREMAAAVGGAECGERGFPVDEFLTEHGLQGACDTFERLRADRVTDEERNRSPLIVDTDDLVAAIKAVAGLADHFTKGPAALHAPPTGQTP